MNKYDNKVIEFASESAYIYELLPKKISGTSRKIFDFLTDNFLDYGKSIKQL